MGIPIFILGRSGAGKSASLRNFPSEGYSLIEVDGKPLPFRSEKKFMVTDSYAKITELLTTAKADTIVIDDSQYLMANEFMRRAKETGYQKFTDIGANFFNLINLIKSLPKQKIVYFLHHEETDTYGNVTAKTIGKMLDDKISLEGKFTIVIRAMSKDKEFYFSTQSDGQDTAKTPMGMFETDTIDNDLYLVDKTVREYYGLTKKSEASNENSLV